MKLWGANIFTGKMKEFLECFVHPNLGKNFGQYE